MNIPTFINPAWNSTEYYTLNYKEAHYRDSSLNDTYVAAGHSLDCMIISHYFEPNPMPNSVNYIKQQFEGIKNIAIAVNLFKPGSYLPMHKDLYGKYRDLHGQDLKVFRAIIMLEDSVPGQIIQIENKAWAEWKAGTVFHWFDETEHAFYNLSLKNRYAIQLTGTVTE